MSSTAFQRKLDLAPTATIDKVDLNNRVVMMRAIVRRAKLHTINGLVKKMHKLKNKKGTEVQQNQNKSKAERLLEEVKILKILKPDYVSKYALGSTERFEELVMKPSTTLDMRALARLSQQKFIQDVVIKFRSEHEDWRDLAAYLMTKQTSREFKKKKTKENKKKVETNVKASETLVQTYLDEKLDGRDDLDNADDDNNENSSSLLEHESNSIIDGDEDDDVGKQSIKLLNKSKSSSTVQNHRVKQNLSTMEGYKVEDEDKDIKVEIKSNILHNDENNDDDDDVGDEGDNSSHDNDGGGDDDDDVDDDESHSDSGRESDDIKEKNNSLTRTSVERSSHRLTVHTSKQNKISPKVDLFKEKTKSKESNLTDLNFMKQENEIPKRKTILTEKVEGEMIVKKFDLGKDFVKDEIPTILLSNSEEKLVKRKKKTKDLFFDLDEDDVSGSHDNDVNDYSDNVDFDGDDRNEKNSGQTLFEGSIQPTMSAFSTTFVGSLNSSKMMSCKDSQYRSNEDWKRIRHENKEQNMGSGSGSSGPFQRGRGYGRGSFSSYGTQRGRGFSQGSQGASRGRGQQPFRGGGFERGAGRGQRGDGQDGGKGDSSGEAKKPEALHPSWAASKKRKQEQKGILQAFSGKKVKFDD